MVKGYRSSEPTADILSPQSLHHCWGVVSEQLVQNKIHARAGKVDVNPRSKTYLNKNARPSKRV